MKKISSPPCRPPHGLEKTRLPGKAAKPAILSSALTLLLCVASCDANGTADIAGPDALHDRNGAAGHPRQNDKTMGNMINITVGSSTFTATLSNTKAADAFKALLPLTVRMDDVNGNEKFYRMPKSLPAAAANPGTIREGDLMLWGTDGVVLFYKTFSTPYSYTRLGRIGNASGLAKALGAGTVTVTFELKRD